jgi:serine/threonine protein kinase
MDASRVSGVVDMVDALLASFLKSAHTTMLVEPGENGQLLTFEPSKESLSFDSALGDAIAARLIFISGIEIPTKNQQFGKFKVRVEQREEEIFVGARTTPQGLAVELWRKGAPEQNSRFSLYELQEQIGKGGFGVVYRAIYKPLQRTVALKVLHENVAQDHTHRERFLREALLASRVRHLGLVEIMDFGFMPDGRSFLVMEFVDGIPLRELLQKQKTLPPARVVAICLQLAAALGVLHGAGLVHRDIKPENIFIGANDLVKLGDFGATKEYQSQEPSITQIGMIFGTPPYMSPETIQGMAIDHRSDLYSVGCLLYEMLMGAPPFKGKTPHEFFAAHLSAPTPTLGDAFPEVLQSILDGLLEKFPDERYPNTTELIKDLERAKAALARSGWRRWLPA